jgi:hypothetical protein
VGKPNLEMTIVFCFSGVWYCKIEAQSNLRH